MLKYVLQHTRNLRYKLRNIQTTTMNKTQKKLSIIFLPSLFWIGLTALRFGAQSISNIIELLGVLVLSLISTLIPERVIKFRYLIIILLNIAFWARFLMSSIPE